jgi:hypothetical protein
MAHADNQPFDWASAPSEKPQGDPKKSARGGGRWRWATRREVLVTVGLIATGFAVAYASSAFGRRAEFGQRMEVNGGELYYTSVVTEAEARKVGGFLRRVRLFDGQRNTAQLDKQEGVYLVRLVVQQWAQDNPEQVATAAQLCKQLSEEVFLTDRVAVHLCDDRLKTVKVVGPMP